MRLNCGLLGPSKKRMHADQCRCPIAAFLVNDTKRSIQGAEKPALVRCEAIVWSFSRCRVKNAI